MPIMSIQASYETQVYFRGQSPLSFSTRSLVMSSNSTAIEQSIFVHPDLHNKPVSCKSIHYHCTRRHCLFTRFRLSTGYHNEGTSSGYKPFASGGAFSSRPTRGSVQSVSDTPRSNASACGAHQYISHSDINIDPFFLLNQYSCVDLSKNYGGDADGQGYLYAYVEDDEWKVGLTNNFVRRQEEWNKGCPCPWRIWLLPIRVANRWRAEALAHLLLEMECLDRLRTYCRCCRRTHIEKFVFSGDWPLSREADIPIVKLSLLKLVSELLGFAACTIYKLKNVREELGKQVLNIMNTKILKHSKVLKVLKHSKVIKHFKILNHYAYDASHIPTRHVSQHPRHHCCHVFRPPDISDVPTFRRSDLGDVWTFRHSDIGYG
ncbi:hypothetical protein EV368DRAFT_68487 [Lentinula lateritia]|nr:hypothetical protein EV368DRAFT_68487 [Lentinula lateritia]